MLLIENDSRIEGGNKEKSVLLSKENAKNSIITKIDNAKDAAAVVKSNLGEGDEG